MDSALTTGFGSDVANALNAIPGVLMETRGLGGSRDSAFEGLRFGRRFAVRNTMLFVHGFCLTESDGTSPVEWLGAKLVVPASRGLWTGRHLVWRGLRGRHPR